MRMLAVTALMEVGFDTGSAEAGDVGRCGERGDRQRQMAGNKERLGDCEGGGGGW